ncbi:MAG: hypothetical protein J6U10_03555 [Lachnospiraceae bacterium]|nr:hypothetical protein [Lachnospiraceae bacterium]
MGYCSNCGKYGMGKFCENCGSLLTLDKNFIGMGHNQSGLRLEYSTTGMMCDGGFTYKVWEEAQGAKLLVRKPGVNINNAPVFDVDSGFLDSIKKTMETSGCELWNGFNKHMQGVMDGTSYYFSYSDGKGVNIHWSGYMATPEGFGACGAVLTSMFDAVYEEHFPNYYNKMRQYLENVIKPEYGVSRQGYSVVSYKHVIGNTYERVGWNIPTGCLFATVGKFSQYVSEIQGIRGIPGNQGLPTEQDKDERQWAEAFTVFLDTRKEEGIDAPGSHLKLIFRWYEADKEGVRMTGEVVPSTDVIAADCGYTFVFSYIHENTTYFGFFSRLFFAFGKDCIDYTLLLYCYKDGKWQWIDGLHNRSDINDLSRDDLNGFVEFARKYGMGKLADKWDKGGMLNMNLLDQNVMIHFKWSNNLDNEFAKKLEEVPDGKLVPSYEIKVETAVYRCFFPM